jgi:hypothetical protein
MRIKELLFIFIATLLTNSADVRAVDTKPNFSGTWTLDRQKSDLGGGNGSGHNRSGGSRMGSMGTGIPGSGYPGMGGPRTGGGAGGPQTGDPGLGGTSTGQNRYPSTETGEAERPRRPQIPESIVVEHAEPQLIVKQKINREGEEQFRELKYTTDGKTNRNEGFRGYIVESQTSWKDEQLVTKSTIDTDNGMIKITEVRSLSADGKTMTVEIKSSGGSMDRQQKLVYVKD